MTQPSHAVLIAEIVELKKQRDEMLEALKGAVERMEAVAERIPVHNRSKGVSQATHVAHMAGHLAQHAKIARAAIAKAEPVSQNRGKVK